MKKAKILGIYGLLYIAISLVVLLIPTGKQFAFWAAYIFFTIALVFNVFVLLKNKYNLKTMKSSVARLSIFYMNIIYLIGTIIVLVVATIFSQIPSWIVMIISIILLVCGLLGLITVDTSIDYIEKVDSNVAEKVYYLKELQVELELLIDKENDESIKSEIASIVKLVEFSDPVTNDKLRDIEKIIIDNVSKYNTEKSYEEKIKILSEIKELLNERNKKAKILK